MSFGGRRLACLSSSVVFLGACAATAVRPPSAPQGDVRTGRIDGEIQALLDRFHTPGAVVEVTEGGRVTYARAFGMRDAARGLRTNLETQFEIGSITKQVTAAAILQLEEAGRLHIDSTLAKRVAGLFHLVFGCREAELVRCGDWLGRRQATRVRAGLSMAVLEHGLHPARSGDRGGLRRVVQPLRANTSSGSCRDVAYFYARRRIAVAGYEHRLRFGAQRSHAGAQDQRGSRLVGGQPRCDRR
jgi:hypothetical protein